MQRFRGWLQRWLYRRKPWTEQTYVALDVESSGLDPRSDQLLAVAWVVIKPPIIDYASGRYFLLKHDRTDLKQSPVVHGLVRKDFIDPTHPAQVLHELAAVLNGHTLVCHYIQLDWGFLQQAAKQHGVNLAPFAKFDTLAYEAQRLKRHQHHIARGELTLSACRQRYGLPEYNAHHAFSDAIACGELMLAQRYK